MKLKIDFEIAQNELAQTWPSFFMLGSCFAQNQAERMAQLGFDVLSNPFGIIYNPISIQNLLQRISNNTAYTETDFNQRNTVFSWEHHGDFKYSGVTPAVETSNVILTTARQAAQKADVILVVNDGEIIEQGKHKELISKNGVSSKLIKLQSFS